MLVWAESAELFLFGKGTAIGIWEGFFSGFTYKKVKWCNKKFYMQINKEIYNYNYFDFVI